MVEGADSCDVICNTEDPEELNRLCACALVDVGHVRESLGISAPGATTQDPGLHAHLFSPYALFVHRTSLDLMGAVAQPCSRSRAIGSTPNTSCAGHPALPCMTPAQVVGCWGWTSISPLPARG